MGNHNIELIAPMQSFQYGEQSFALPVEATGHVGDDLGVGVEFPHLSDLSAEVPTLLGGTDSTVADDIGPGCSAQIGINVVEPLTSGVPIVGDFALFSIPSQRLGVQAQHRSGFTACNVHHDRNIHYYRTMLNELLPRHQPSETEGSASEWSRVYAALGGDSAHELMQADFAKHPEAVRLFADTFLAVHHQRLLAEEDPVVTFSAAEAEDWIQRSEIAIAEFLSVEPKQRRAFALELLPVQPSEK